LDWAFFRRHTIDSDASPNFRDLFLPHTTPDSPIFIAPPDLSVILQRGNTISTF
jgi:hypothetical protein